MSATNKEIAEKIVRASDDWNWEGEQFEKYVDAITAALDLKDDETYKWMDVAEAWMKECDALRAKYEPKVAVTSEALGGE